MIELRQSTAVDLLIGPFIDETDGKTAETGLTVTQAEVRLSKNGGNMAQKNEATSLAHDELGYYVCKLDTTDTNTLGILKIMVHESGGLPVWETCMVMPANVWDSLFSTDKLQVDAVEISSDSTAADNLELIIETAKGADHKILISSDAQDLSASLDVNTKTLETGLDLTDTMKASVNTEVDNGLDTAIPGSPTADSINERVKAVDDLSQASGGGDLAAIKDKTDTIPASPAAVGSLMGLSNDAITSAKFDESTAFPVKSADADSTKIARVGADSDTLETLSDQLDTAQVDLDNSDQYKADVSGLATVAELSTHNDNLGIVDGKIDTIDTVVDAVKVETDKLNNMIEADGEDFRYTENALEQAPAGGGGGDASAENQTTIIDHLTDLKGTGFVKDTDSMVDLAHEGADGDTLETLSDQLDTSGAVAGAGAIEVVYTLTDEDTGDPIADADLWVTSDAAGSNVLGSGKTDQYGKATFYLDAGTVYIWRQKSGWNFDNPDTEVVS